MDEQSSAEPTEPTGPGFVQFRMACPNCSMGITRRPQMAARAAVGLDGKPNFIVGTTSVGQQCQDCHGDGWLPLGSGEWKGRPKPASTD